MSDLIDRQAAIDDIWTVSPLAHLDREWIDRWLRQLPPANNSEIPNSSDTISRAKAIEALKSRQDNGEGDINRFYNTIIQNDIEAIEQLPPAQPEPSQVAKDITRIVENEQDMRVIAQPEIIRCKDCKHWIPYDWMFSEVWQSRNINDYPEDEIGCNYCDMAMKANDFCSRGERREVTG